MWGACLRAIDDIKDSVRDEANVTLKTLGKLTVWSTEWDSNRLPVLCSMHPCACVCVLSSIVSRARPGMCATMLFVVDVGALCSSDAVV